MADRKALFFNAGSFELIDESGDVFVAPTGGVKLGGTTALTEATGLLQWGGAGVAMSADLGVYATSQYVDGLVQGLSIKNSCVVATVADITDLSAGAPSTVDSIVLAEDDRVLVKAQTTGSENGIYKVDTLGTGSNGIWSRVSDMAAASDASGVFTFVEEGTTADTGWVCTNDSGSDTVATHALVFSQFSGAGSYTGGDGLTLSGVSFSVNVDDSTIEINADTLRVKDAGITMAKLNIAGGSNLGSAALHQSEDEFPFSDNGTNKVVTFSNLEDSIFANISGDATIAAGGALTIAATSVENSMLAGSIAMTKLDIAGGSNLGSATLHQSQDEFPFSDNGTQKVVTFSNLEDSIFANISGDATVAAGGALTIGADAVELSMLDIAGATDLGGANLAQEDEFAIDDGGTQKKVNFSDLEDSIFGNVSGDMTAAAGGAFTLGAGVVDSNELAGDAVTGTELADDAVDSEHYTDGSIDPVHLADGLLHGSDSIYQLALTSGEAFSIGMAVYLRATNGKAYKAINTGAEGARPIGIALEAASGADESKSVMICSGVEVTIPLAGRDGLLTAGALAYVDSTAGQLTTSTPGSGAWSNPVGVATDTDKVVFLPGNSPVQIP